MSRFLGFALLSLLCSTLEAASPALTVPATITGQAGAFITVPATTSAKNVKWLALDPGLNLFPVDLLKDNHTAIVSSGTPGSYRLLAITASGDELSDPALCTVTIQGNTPSPTPAPPTPTPTPPAAAKAAWAVVILDNNARTPAMARLLTSQSLLTALQQRGVRLRVLDITDPVIAENNYQPGLTQAGGAPALLAYDDKGNRLKALKLPGDEAAFLNAIPTAPPASLLNRMLPSCGPNGCPFRPNDNFVYPEIAR